MVGFVGVLVWLARGVEFWCFLGFCGSCGVDII